MYWSIPANTAVHGEMCCTDTDDDGDSRAAVVQRISFFFQYNSYRWTFIAYARITSAKRAIFAPIIFQSIDCVIRHKNVARFRQIWETKSK